MTDLPEKPLWRISEAAAYFDVAESTIRLWIAHKLLTKEQYRGVVRITRESIVKLRIASRIDPDE